MRTFSGGMKRRLQIVRSLLHHPKLLFLDEPTAGLEPRSRDQIWTHLHQQQGLTVFLTTHYLHEAEHCDRIAIIDRGRLIACDTPAALKACIGHDRIHLRTSDDHSAAPCLRDTFALPVRPDGLTFTVADGAAFGPRLCAALTVESNRSASPAPPLTRCS
ncbi:ATP-binding cassette domain-containing protein [Nonomuraea sp. NPDC059023]|uniref:ATP-binding cassette domain-containing protein n=1 Tax=unclassified Nonomuraea TaxID=2593643 RepID=UPI0036D08396